MAAGKVMVEWDFTAEVAEGLERGGEGGRRLAIGARINYYFGFGVAFEEPAVLVRMAVSWAARTCGEARSE